MNELISNGAVCRSALATPGLLNTYIYLEPFQKSYRKHISLSSMTFQIDCDHKVIVRKHLLVLIIATFKIMCSDHHDYKTRQEIILLFSFSSIDTSK